MYPSKRDLKSFILKGYTGSRVYLARRQSNSNSLNNPQMTCIDTDKRDQLASGPVISAAAASASALAASARDTHSSSAFQNSGMSRLRGIRTPSSPGGRRRAVIWPVLAPARASS